MSCKLVPKTKTQTNNLVSLLVHVSGMHDVYVLFTVAVGANPKANRTITQAKFICHRVAVIGFRWVSVSALRKNTLVVPVTLLLPVGMRVNGVKNGPFFL